VCEILPHMCSNAGGCRPDGPSSAQSTFLPVRDARIVVSNTGCHVVDGHPSPFAGLGTFVPHLVARNLLPTPQTVTVTLEYPRKARAAAPSAGEAPTLQTAPTLAAYVASDTGTITLPPFTLEPYAIAFHLCLPRLRAR
jgi:hypothetical protein